MGESICKEPIKEATIIVSNYTEVQETYPKLFSENIGVDIAPIYLEKNMAEQSDFKEEKRIFLLPSGILEVSTEDLDYLWSIGVNNKELLEELNRQAREMKDLYAKDKEKKLFIQKDIESINYGINYIPYNDVTASSYLLNKLDELMNKYVRK